MGRWHTICGRKSREEKIKSDVSVCLSICVCLSEAQNYDPKIVHHVSVPIEFLCMSVPVEEQHGGRVFLPREQDRAFLQRFTVII